MTLLSYDSTVFSDLKDKYLGEFAFVCENNSGRASVAQGEMFEEKN
jgi:hypothetical protein